MNCRVHWFSHVNGFLMGNKDEIDDRNSLLPEVRELLKNILSFTELEQNRFTCETNSENYVLATQRHNHDYNELLDLFNNALSARAPI